MTVSRPGSSGGGRNPALSPGMPFLGESVPTLLGQNPSGFCPLRTGAALWGSLSFSRRLNEKEVYLPLQDQLFPLVDLLFLIKVCRLQSLQNRKTSVAV